MRRSFILFALVVLAIAAMLAFWGCDGDNGDDNNNWQLSEIESILFPTDNTGMATDTDGSLWVTTDGGGNWERKSYRGGGLAYSGPGWLYCRGDSFLYSTDNGDHWNVYDSLDGHIPFIHVLFVDHDNGFVFNTTVEETVIGTMPDCYSEYHYFLTIQRIISGVVQSSIDTSIEMFYCVEDDCEDISGISSMHSWSFGDTVLGLGKVDPDNPDPVFFTIIRSVGSGSPWEIDTSGLSVSIISPYDLCFYSSSCGLLVGENGLCRQTLDGGVTWLTITTPAGGNDLFDIDIRGNKTIAVGENGTIIESNNFTVTGISWYEIESGTDSDINAVSITPGGNVWVGGQDGLKKLE